MATIKDAHIFKDGKPVMRGNATYENSTLTIKEAKWTDDGAKKNLPFMMKGGMEVKVKVEGQQMDGHANALPPNLQKTGTKWQKEMKATKLPNADGEAHFHG